MTFVHLLSDLHLEFHPYTYRKPRDKQVDLIVLAGDISSKVGHASSRTADNRLLTLLRQCGQVAPVVYVPGNHDFYGSTIDNRMQELRAMEQYCPRLHVMNSQAKDIAGIRIAGATLWTDFSLPGFGFGVREAQQMSDFRMIGGRDGQTAIRPEEMASRYREAVHFLDTEIASLTPPDLVVTHFLPCPEAIDEKYARSPLNAYFCTDLRRLMSLPTSPHTWAFGHTHHCVDRQVMDTRVVCNPRGYPGENLDYDSNLVIEVPARQSGNGTPKLQG